MFLVNCFHLPTFYATLRILSMLVLCSEVRWRQSCSSLTLTPYPTLVVGAVGQREGGISDFSDLTFPPDGRGERTGLEYFRIEYHALWAGRFQE